MDFNLIYWSLSSEHLDLDRIWVEDNIASITFKYCAKTINMKNKIRQRYDVIIDMIKKNEIRVKLNSKSTKVKKNINVTSIPLAETMWLEVCKAGNLL